MDKIYQLVSNNEKGFSIIKEKKRKYNTDGSVEKLKTYEYLLWIDECEGGEAYITDWTFVETFGSESDAMKHILENYGEVIEIEIEL